MCNNLPISPKIENKNQFLDLRQNKFLYQVVKQSDQSGKFSL